MSCNIDTNSGLKVFVFPQESLFPSYPVCSGLFLPKIFVGSPSISNIWWWWLLCLLTRWQALILSVGISQPTFLKILRTLSSSSFCLTDSGILATSKHSLLEYWAFAQHCLCKSMTLCWSKELTFYVTRSCYSRLVNLSFNLRTFSSNLVLDWISVWSDSTTYIFFEQLV